MRCWLLAGILALAVTAPGEAQARRPRLDLRASPRMALSPVHVVVVAELVGGDEVEDFYCPLLEWDFDDGAKSTHQSDCAPYGPETELERRFSAGHDFHQPGDYNVSLTLKRSGRSVATASTSIDVH